MKDKNTKGKFKCPNCAKILENWFQVHNCVLQRAAKKGGKNGSRPRKV